MIPYQPYMVAAVAESARDAGIWHVVDACGRIERAKAAGRLMNISDRELVEMVYNEVCMANGEA
jgi:hypothetical protein